MTAPVSAARADDQGPAAEPKVKGREASASIGNRYETIIVESREKVGLITLNRPKTLNALSSQVAAELLEALKNFDRDERIGAIVVTGSVRAFAAGADIEEMAEKAFNEFYMRDFLAPWDEIAHIGKPIIAAVSGYALGGGCELALACDFIIASEDAQFGQPEIKLGILPGIGGSQRLTRAVGKSLAMDMILTGRNIGAAEAKQVGIVGRIVAAADLLQTALEAAHTIASYNAPAVRMAKQAVNRAFESPLSEGLKYERLLFQAAFSTEGQKEGMAAFLAKRAPVFRNR
jgi:enoyl-CoA hydratase